MTGPVIGFIILAAAGVAGLIVKHGFPVPPRRGREPRHAVRAERPAGSRARRDPEREFWDIRDQADPDGTLWLRALAHGPGYEPVPGAPQGRREQRPAVPAMLPAPVPVLPSPAPPLGMPWPPAPPAAPVPPLAMLVRENQGRVPAAAALPGLPPAAQTSPQPAVTCDLGGRSTGEVVDEIFSAAETSVAVLLAEVFGSRVDGGETA